MDSLFVILPVFLLHGLSTATEKTEKCQMLIDAASNVVDAEPEALAYWNDITTRHLDLDITNTTARDIFLCKFANVTTLRQLYDILPRTPYKGSYKGLNQRYRFIQSFIIRVYGGYTNFKRFANVRVAISKWRAQLQPVPHGSSLRNETDLEKLIDFLKIMQVKYGSRGMSLVVGAHYQTLLIENPEEFARKLYVLLPLDNLESIEAAEKLTGLGLFDTQALERRLTYYEPPKRGYTGYKPADIVAVNLLEDMGYFNLEV